MREAIINLSEYRQKAFTGDQLSTQEKMFTFREFTRRVQTVVNKQRDVLISQLKRNKVTIIDGLAEFTSPNEIQVVNHDFRKTTHRAKNFVISVGSRPDENPTFPINGKSIINTNQLLSLSSLPKNMIIVGGSAHSIFIFGVCSFSDFHLLQV